MNKFRRKIRYKLYHYVNKNILSRNKVLIGSDRVIGKNIHRKFSNLLNETREKLRSLVDHSALDCYLQHIAIDSTLRSDMIRQADEIVSNKLTVFGNTYLYEKNINWHIDMVSGFEWEMEYSSGIKIIDLGNNADVKFPWELNRLQFLLRLGSVYFVTGKEEYSAKYIEMINSWVRSNPKHYGINWASPFEVSIRLINLIWSYSFFIHSEHITEKQHLKIHNLIHVHAKYLFANLEDRGRVNHNHYMGNIVGLYYYSVFFPSYNISKAMKKFAINELKYEYNAQTFMDGVNFEQSTGYHVFVTEMILHSLVINYMDHKISSGKENEDSFDSVCINTFGAQYLKLFNESVRFLYCIIKPDLSLAHIGDCDSGTLIRFSPVAESHHLSVLLCCCSLLDENIQNLPEVGTDEYALWVSKLNKNSSMTVKTALEGSAGFKDSGFYIMRNSKSYLITRCGPVGTNGKGSHTHNDNLSFELCLDGQSIIIERGTYTYTRYPSLRNEYRSIKSHNTVCVDDIEPGRMSTNDLFDLGSISREDVLKWSIDERYDEFEGQINYDSSNKNIKHKRHILFDKESNEFTFTDMVDADAKVIARWCFHFPEGTRIIKDSTRIHVELNNGNSFNIKIVEMEALKCEIENIEISNEYDNCHAGLRVTLEKLIEPPQSLSYTIQSENIQ